MKAYAYLHSAWDALDGKLRKHHAGGGRLEGIMHSGGHAADCMYSKSAWTHTVGDTCRHDYMQLCYVQSCRDTDINMISAPPTPPLPQTNMTCKTL